MDKWVRSINDTHSIYDWDNGRPSLKRPLDITDVEDTLECWCDIKARTEAYAVIHKQQVKEQKLH